MENQILLITDFSKASWNALTYGMEVYKKTKAKFFILHCYKKELLKQNKKEEKLKSEIGLQRIMQGIGFRKENVPHEFEIISSPKKISDAVGEIFNSFKIDLIILGSKGDFAGINYALVGIRNQDLQSYYIRRWKYKKYCRLSPATFVVFSPACKVPLRGKLLL
jgi:hypothetical protein